MVTIASAVMVLTSWLRRRRRRYLLLAFISPLPIPLLCATFPLLCAIEVCIRLCWRRIQNLAEDHGGDGLRRCEEGRDGSEGDDVRLLQRYLEDQLLLVVGSVYDFGDCDGDDCISDGVQYFDNRGPLFP
ncbi:uncharacterized protein LOC130776655 [Actinidia eriantha]|uniref:uncharacterized protein LOC130776655 n=1 Tax=Actinidia eriantha TaxID=165200 RepID=UPI0025862A87|nr:uncharacterized protein LOC130776655 [Actinidia eriantha]